MCPSSLVSHLFWVWWLCSTFLLFLGLIILRRGNQNDLVVSHGLGPPGTLVQISCGQGSSSFLWEEQLFQACLIKLKEFKWVADSWELYLSSGVSGKERAKVEIWEEWVRTKDLFCGWTEEKKEYFSRIRVHNQEWWEVRRALSLVKIRGSERYCRKLPWKVRFLVSSLCWMEISGWLGSSNHPIMKYCMLNTIASSWARRDVSSPSSEAWSTKGFEYFCLL